METGMPASLLSAYAALSLKYPDQPVPPEIERILRLLRSKPELLSDQQFTAMQSTLAGLAARGNQSAMLLLAERTRKTDPATAFNWYTAAATAGNLQARTALGMMYNRGEGVPRDVSRAIAQFRECAADGDPAAKNELAKILLQRGTADRAEALKLLTESVDSGQMDATVTLATLYETGIGVRQDFGEAVRLYSVAASSGSPAALTGLGILYMRGKGVRRNPKLAMELFLRASQAGYSRATYFYAESLEQGIASAKDSVEAESWYRKAAQEGNPEALQWCRDKGVDITP